MVRSIAELVLRYLLKPLSLPSSDYPSYAVTMFLDPILSFARSPTFVLFPRFLHIQFSTTPTHLRPLCSKPSIFSPPSEAPPASLYTLNLLITKFFSILIFYFFVSMFQPSVTLLSNVQRVRLHQTVEGIARMYEKKVAHDRQDLKGQELF